MSAHLRKKLIEVALPLEAINKASAREKSIRHGHPSTLHLWWARRPLAAARAVIFAQMVDDPSANPDLLKTEAAQQKERQRLFKIIEQLVQGENTTNEAEKRIGHLYPKIEITAEMAKERPDLKPLIGQKLAVIAWIWARTVKSPNPAFRDVDVPLASTFTLSVKAGKEAYVEPVIENGS